MASKIYAIKEITPATPYPWTVKAIVLEKSLPRESKPIPYKKQLTFQRLVIADSEGTRVQLSIFGDDIVLFEDKLLVGRKYNISSCRVTHIKEKFRIVPNDYQWTLLSKSNIKEVPKNDVMILPQLDDFVSFDNLEPYRDSLTKTVDIIGIALHLNPVKERKMSYGPARIQEVFLIDTEMKPILFSMWNQFVDVEGMILLNAMTRKPVIVARRLKVVSYNGTSLATNSQSSIAIDQDTLKARQLNTWLSNNLEKVNEFMASESFNAFTYTSRNYAPREITSIASLVNLPNNKNYSLKCTLEVTDLTQKFYYMSCEACHGGTFTPFMHTFDCNTCKRVDVHAVPWCCLHLKATDPSGTIHGTMFGIDAEKVISCKATTIMHNLDNDPKIEISSLIKSKSDEEVNVVVKPHEKYYHGKMKIVFNLSFADNYSTPATMASPSTPAKKKENMVAESSMVEQAQGQYDVTEISNTQNAPSLSTSPLES